MTKTLKAVGLYASDTKHCWMFFHLSHMQTDLAFVILNLGHWNLCGIWCLKIGIYKAR